MQHTGHSPSISNSCLPQVPYLPAASPTDTSVETSAVVFFLLLRSQIYTPTELAMINMSPFGRDDKDRNGKTEEPLH